MNTKNFLSEKERSRYINELTAEIENNHLCRISDSDGDVLRISKAYSGVWLEHVYDSLVLGELSADYSIAKNQIGLFFKSQRPDGCLPLRVCADSVDYDHIQECVSIGSLCLIVYEKTGDKEFLERSYRAVSKWDAWLEKNRTSMGTGLIEMYCGYDTGHDNSCRLKDMKYKKGLSGSHGYPLGCPVLPCIAPDMNAVFYGNRVALSKMAGILCDAEAEKTWAEKAENVRKKLFDICFDEADAFFYDVDKNGNKRKYKHIGITNVISEGVCGQSLTDEIFLRYLWNPKEFYTRYPFPSMSLSCKERRLNRPGNSWGYYTQGLTVLRCRLWMPSYGKTTEYREIMQKWLYCHTNSLARLLPNKFGQEVYPTTGLPSNSSPYYSSCILACLIALRDMF